MASKIRVVMADDHQIFLDGLSRLLFNDQRIDVVGSCLNGDALIDMVRVQNPDIAIVDISMPGPGPAGIVDAIEAINLLEATQVSTRTVALTMHLEPSFARELLAHGMDGYVVKEAAYEELIEALLCVHRGDQYLCRSLVEATSHETPLTERERACLSGAARGQTAKVIALELNITERTVRFHFANACRKIGVQRLTEAIAAALKLNLISV